jgi:hypothetical protein
VNLDLSDVLLITALVMIGALFWRSHGIRERALVATRRFCERQKLEFLDESVGLEKLTLSKDNHGKRRITRIYRFEFTVTGGERYEGRTVVQGGVTQRVELPPHRYTPPPEELH